MTKEEINDPKNKGVHYYHWQQCPKEELPQYFREILLVDMVFDTVEEIDGVRYAVNGDYKQPLDKHFFAITKEEFLLRKNATA